MIRLSGYALVFGLSLIAQDSVAYDINGYAVAYHRSCGSSNLPATIRELNKFFAADNFPEEARKNFLWTDSRVRANEWHRDNDSFESTETASGYDGVDSGLISYIASHGVTYSGRYIASAGSNSNGGCEIESENMTLGDQWARYLVLSTCQGLKIGSGSSPSRPGEDPSETWNSAAAGMNCIYGYSNNMVDADGYGVYWLNNIVNSEESLAESFLRAGRQVSYSNIPAALCFGTDENNARYNLETLAAFTPDRVGGEESAWMYRNSEMVSNKLGALPSISGSLTLATAPRNIEAIASRVLGGTFTTSYDRHVASYKSELGTLKVDHKFGVISFVKSRPVSTRSVGMSDAELIASALNHVQAIHGKVALDPSYVLNKGTKVNGVHTIVEKTVVLHQVVEGTLMLGTAGSIEVSFDADGEMVGFTSALRSVDSTETTQIESLDVLHHDFVKVVEDLRSEFPGALIKHKSTKYGWDSGSYYDEKSETSMVALIELEVTEGKFSRVFQRRVKL